MFSSPETTYFRSLAALAVGLLWGVSLANGTVKAMILAVKDGQFSNGTPLKTHFTGVFLIDIPISLLVSFFYFGTNGQDSEYQHFLIDAYSTLQSAFVWLYAESARKQPKPASIM